MAFGSSAHMASLTSATRALAAFNGKNEQLMDVLGLPYGAVYANFEAIHLGRPRKWRSWRSTSVSPSPRPTPTLRRYIAVKPPLKERGLLLCAIRDSNPGPTD